MVQDRLRISVTANEVVPVHLTPVDVPVSGATDAALKQVITVADLADAKAGDGKFEYSTVVPIKEKIFGFAINLNVPLTVVVEVDPVTTDSTAQPALS